MKKARYFSSFAAAIAATALFAGCGGDSNCVVDSTEIDAPRTVETAPENAPPQDAPDALPRSDSLEIGGVLRKLAPERALFNGENLDGWTNADGAAPDPGWTVADGVLRLTTPDGSGDLFTADRFADYVFSFEFRFGKECNSGVKYKLDRPNGKDWIGLEYQIQDDANVADGKIANRKIASVFDALAASDPSKPIAPPTEAAPTGDFHSGKIVVCGKKVEHWLDGERVLAFEIGSDLWNAGKAAGKFKNQKTFGEIAVGPIMFQNHGYPVDFRNVTIREILPE